MPKNVTTYGAGANVMLSFSADMSPAEPNAQTNKPVATNINLLVSPRHSVMGRRMSDAGDFLQ